MWILNKLRHCHIINIYRLVMNEFQKTEWTTVGFLMPAAQKSLFNYIFRDNRRRDFSNVEKIKIALEMAKALEYLHNTAHVIHADFNPRNVLLFTVDEEIQCVKICDFGSSSLITEERPLGCGTDPFRCKKQHLGEEYNTEADVHGYGATLYFVCAKQIPYERYCKSDDGNYNWQIACNKLHGLDGGQPKRPPRNLRKFGKLAALVQKCWDPLHRYQITYAVHKLEQWINQDTKIF